MQAFTEVITVAAAGTPQAITAPTAAQSPTGMVTKVTIKALQGNTGSQVYVGASGFVKATGVGLYRDLNDKNSVWEHQDMSGCNTIKLSDIYVDVATSADKVIVTWWLA